MFTGALTFPTRVLKAVFCSFPSIKSFLVTALSEEDLSLAAEACNDFNISEASSSFEAVSLAASASNLVSKINCLISLVAGFVNSSFLFLYSSSKTFLDIKISFANCFGVTWI